MKMLDEIESTTSEWSEYLIEPVPNSQADSVRTTSSVECCGRAVQSSRHEL